MKALMAGLTAILLVLLLEMPVIAMNNAGQAADCSTYARNRAESERSAGRDTLGGGVRGAAGGALFGAIVGGKKGARRGAALGGGLGAVRGGVRSSDRRQMNYQYYYDSCMRGQVY